MSDKNKDRVPERKLRPPSPCNAATRESVPLTPLGTLSIFAREARDEIYRHVCKQEYWYLEEGTWLSYRQSNSFWKGQRLHKLPILQVCKTICEEFLPVLCSEGEFEINQSSFSYKTQRSDVPFVNEISNIKIVLSLTQGAIHYTDGSPNSWGSLWSSAGPVSFFTGTSVMRNTCVVKLSECTPLTLLLLKSSLMLAISQLTGFKTVRLILSTGPDYWLKGDTPEDVREIFRGLDTCPAFDTIVFRISHALGPALGSFTTGGRLNEPTRWTQYVTFHPQGHLPKKVKSLGAESDTRMDEVPLPLSTLTWTRSVLDVET